jgi:hypothetical protein
LGEKPSHNEGADVDMKAIDCLVNVHFGETEKQPTWMLKVRDDYFKGPESMFEPVELSKLLDEMDAHGVRKAILMDNLAKPSMTARKFVEEKPERFALAMGGVDLLRPMPSLRELTAITNDLPVAYARTTTVHQHRHPRTADPRGGAEPDSPRPGLRPISRTQAVHDPRRGPMVGHRNPLVDQIRQPAPDDVGVVAEAVAGKPSALYAHTRTQQGHLRLGLAGAQNAPRRPRSGRVGSARRRTSKLSLQQRT